MGRSSHTSHWTALVQAAIHHGRRRAVVGASAEQHLRNWSAAQTPTTVPCDLVSPSHCFGAGLVEDWALTPRWFFGGGAVTVRGRFVLRDSYKLGSATLGNNYCFSTCQKQGREGGGGMRIDKAVDASKGDDERAERAGGAESEKESALVFPGVGGGGGGGGVGGSGSGWSREEVVNWPNAISLARLLSGPLLAWMITHGSVKPALIGLVLAGASDWLDGYVARRMGVNSVLGSYLDPLADKVLVGCTVVSMAYAGLLHPALVALIVARDGVLLAGSFVYRAYTLQWQWSGWEDFFDIGAGGVQKVEPLFISKVNMVLQLALIGTALVQPALDIQDTYSVTLILSWSVVATTTLSWIGYAWVYLRRPDPAVVVRGVAHLPHEKLVNTRNQCTQKRNT